MYIDVLMLFNVFSISKKIRAQHQILAKHEIYSYFMYTNE